MQRGAPLAHGFAEPGRSVVPSVGTIRCHAGPVHGPIVANGGRASPGGWLPHPARPMTASAATRAATRGRPRSATAPSGVLAAQRQARGQERRGPEPDHRADIAEPGGRRVVP